MPYDLCHCITGIIKTVDWVRVGQGCFAPGIAQWASPLRYAPSGCPLGNAWEADMLSFHFIFLTFFY